MGLPGSWGFRLAPKAILLANSFHAINEAVKHTLESSSGASRPADRTRRSQFPGSRAGSFEFASSIKIVPEPHNYGINMRLSLTASAATTAGVAGMDSCSTSAAAAGVAGIDKRLLWLSRFDTRFLLVERKVKSSCRFGVVWIVMEHFANFRYARFPLAGAAKGESIV